MKITRRQLRHILRESHRLLTEDAVLQAIDYARDGYRLKVNGKTIWQGLGNRSGLHDYAYELLGQKWKKSGPRFEKKLEALPPGTEIEVQKFRNINRDRGRWHTVKTLTVSGGPKVSTGTKPSAKVMRDIIQTLTVWNEYENIKRSQVEVVGTLDEDESPFYGLTWHIRHGGNDYAFPDSNPRGEFAGRSPDGEWHTYGW